MPSFVAGGKSYYYNPDSILLKAKDEIFRTFERLKQHHMVKCTRVSLNPRLTRCLGRSFAPRNGIFKIEISPKLAVIGGDEQLKDTSIHEAVHSVCFDLWPGQRVGHGPRWKFLANKAGCEPKACKIVDGADALRRRQKRIEYVCRCRIHKVSKVIHNKILRGQHRICMDCRTRIVRKNSAQGRLLTS